MAKLAIFIPAYNEERSIGSAVLLAKKYGRVFVVDDGSKDNTAMIAASAGATVIKRGKNGGYGAAMKSAFARARTLDAEVFVFLDGDLQHDPADIPKVAAPIISGKADFVLGSRFLGGFENAPRYRKEGVQFLNRLAGAQADHPALDFQCGFRAFSRGALGKIRFHEEGYGACSEIAVCALAAGLRVKEVPISVRYYKGANSSDIGRGAGLAGYIFGEIAKRRPLLVFGLVGVLLIACSALLGIFVVDTFYATKVLPVGSAMLSVFSGIGGMVCILIGINLYTLGAVLKKRGNDG